jgi:hypothetical protein
MSTLKTASSIDFSKDYLEGYTQKQREEILANINDHISMIKDKKQKAMPLFDKIKQRIDEIERAEYEKDYIVKDEEGYLATARFRLDMSDITSSDTKVKVTVGWNYIALRQRDHILLIPKGMVVLDPDDIDGSFDKFEKKLQEVPPLKQENPQ